MIFRLADKPPVMLRIEYNSTEIKVSIGFSTFSKVHIYSGSACISLMSNTKLKMAKEIAKMISPKGLVVSMDNTNYATMSLIIPNKSIENSAIFEGQRMLPMYFPRQNFRSSMMTDILIVDDYEINLDILKRQIINLKSSCKCSEGHGDYSIHLAKSGMQAISFVMEQERLKRGYRLILMDCQMPEMDGWEATAKIFELFNTQKISYLPYVIAYSAFDSSVDIKRCFSSGMSGYISKPCYPEELCRIITQWISKPIRIT